MGRDTPTMSAITWFSTPSALKIKGIPPKDIKAFAQVCRWLDLL